AHCRVHREQHRGRFRADCRAAQSCRRGAPELAVHHPGNRGALGLSARLDRARARDRAVPRRRRAPAANRAGVIRLSLRDPPGAVGIELPDRMGVDGNGGASGGECPGRQEPDLWHGADRDSTWLPDPIGDPPGDLAVRRGVAALALFAAITACAGGPPPGATLPTSAPLASRLAPVAHLLDSMIAAGAAPGAVLAVSVDGERFIYGTGRLGLDDPAVPNRSTLYDMASLTKVIALTTLAMMAVEESRLELN